MGHDAVLVELGDGAGAGGFGHAGLQGVVGEDAAGGGGHGVDVAEPAEEAGLAVDVQLGQAADARRQFTRLEELARNRLIATTDVEVARTNLETMEARLEGVMVAMSDRVVRAPFSGLLAHDGWSLLSSSPW